MKRVFLVDIDNGEEYEDYDHWVEKAFANYRGAAQWLLDNDWKPFFKEHVWNDVKDVFESDVAFWKPNEQWSILTREAIIIEMPVE